MKNSQNIKKLIIGAGNILLSDEGIGVHILNEIKKYAEMLISLSKINKSLSDEASLYSNTKFIDIGTSSYDISLYISSKTEKMIIIDSIKTSEYLPGTVFKLGIGDLKKMQINCFSLHQFELIDSLKLYSINKNLPETIILGVVPAVFDVFSTELSELIKIKLPEILTKIKREIRNFF